MSKPIRVFQIPPAQQQLYPNTIELINKHIMACDIDELISDLGINNITKFYRKLPQYATLLIPIPISLISSLSISKEDLEITVGQDKATFWNRIENIEFTYDSAIFMQKRFVSKLSIPNLIESESINNVLEILTEKDNKFPFYRLTNLYYSIVINKDGSLNYLYNEPSIDSTDGNIEFKQFLPSYYHHSQLI